MLVAPRPKPIPAAIGTFFGGLWANLAAMALPSSWQVPVAVSAALITALLIFRLWRLSQIASAPRARLFGKRAYLFAVFAEILAIYVASVMLPRFGWQGYIIQVVGIIVGLHFIGLWAATRSNRFLAIAGGMCIISAMAIHLPTNLHSLNLRDFVTGLGNALVLWIGASRSP